MALWNNRLQTHLAEMIVTGIAGYTAFFAFGARQFIQELLVGNWAVVPWVLPTILGTLAIQIWLPKYATKKSASKKLEPPTVITAGA